MAVRPEAFCLILKLCRLCQLKGFRKIAIRSLSHSTGSAYVDDLVHPSGFISFNAIKIRIYDHVGISITLFQSPCCHGLCQKGC
uniref:Uncharacterized protein n=1 Tax=Pyxicephalus adspersus TaxID=30357 RepID=A0AAV3AF70_PYXAD|nr:TPA: hypothetical protein GDO54_014552 [Pyxicephalus adspersus]